MQPLCQTAAYDFLSSGKPAAERWGDLIKTAAQAGFIRRESTLQPPASGWADVGAGGRNSSGNRFALVHVVRHGSLKVHTATFSLGLGPVSKASQLGANPCESGLARESGVSGDINIDCAAVFASKPAPTGFSVHSGKRRL